MGESIAVGAPLSYHPVRADLDDLVDDTVTRLLVVGGSVPPWLGFTTLEARITTTDGPALPGGIYRYVDDDGVAVMVVDTDAPPGQPATADWDAPDHDPLINTYGWFTTWWDDAEVVPAPRFSARDTVVTRSDGRSGPVRRRRFSAGNWIYSVRLGSSNKEIVESQLDEPADEGDPETWVLQPPGDAQRFAATLTRAKLAWQLTDTVYSFRATKTIFRPYQFRPIIRLLETGTLRLLIADEVGLGKTIEAGLVWTELDARHAADRVLVVCPSMLVEKWRAEMSERFGYDLDVLDRDGLDELYTRVEEDRWPPRFHAICSVERLRIWNRLEDFARWQPRFDLVIVDEAHVFRNMGTRSHNLGGLLSDWAEAMIFLSATPLNLGNDDLYNLLTLLAPGEFDDRHNLELRLEPNAVLHRLGSVLLDKATTADDRLGILDELVQLPYGQSVTLRPEYNELRSLVASEELASDHRAVAEARRLIAQLHALSAVITRTRKIQIQQDKAVREVRTIRVEWTEEEASFYYAFAAWQHRRAKALGAPGFAVQMPLRLASSCLPAARAKVFDDDAHPDEDLDGADSHGVAFGDDVRSSPQELSSIHGAPAEVLAAAAAIPDGADSKFDAFIGPLRQMTDAGHRVLVFTFSRHTLAYLARRLHGRGMRIAELHGGVPVPERHRVMADFRAGDYDVVLASRVASEGLDFEFCSAVVNYDLPWNPMEVEQRIGRVDRFGQENDKVIVVNISTPGTIETDIFQRLMDRIEVFTDSIGELEPILQSRIKDIRETVFEFELSPEQRRARLDATMTAIEEEQLLEQDVQAAASYLTAADDAEIDGLEDALVSQGRYVGQGELGLLLGDWVGTASDESRLEALDDDPFVVLHGSPDLAEQLGEVRAKGERSNAELMTIERDLRNGLAIYLCMDQEHARVTGSPLLTANHPLVRAAVGVPGGAQVRFAHVGLTDTALDPGVYLTVVAMAEWNGVRSSCEFWTTSVPLAAPRSKPSTEVGDELLRALTEARISASSGVLDDDAVQRGLETLLVDLDERRATESDRRKSINEALIAERRASLEQTHRRKLAQIRQAIDTLRGSGNIQMIPAQEGRIRSQEFRYEEQVRELDKMRRGEMSLQYVAVAAVSVS